MDLSCVPTRMWGDLKNGLWCKLEKSITKTSKVKKVWTFRLKTDWFVYAYYCYNYCGQDPSNYCYNYCCHQTGRIIRKNFFSQSLSLQKLASALPVGPIILYGYALSGWVLLFINIIILHREGGRYRAVKSCENGAASWWEAWDGGLSVSLTVRSLHWPPTSFSRDSRTCLSSSPQISMHTSNASYYICSLWVRLFYFYLLSRPFYVDFI